MLLVFSASSADVVDIVKAVDSSSSAINSSVEANSLIMAVAAVD